MSRRKYLPYLFLGAFAALVGYVYYQAKGTDRFDQQFSALLADIDSRLSKAVIEKDSAQACFDYLQTTVRQKLDAMPSPPQPFQRGLKKRLGAFLDGVTKLNKDDPLSAQSDDALRAMSQEVRDIEEARRSAAVVKPLY